MTFSLNLQHFRIFESTGNVPIRPITLLTGSNSAGKSSFLAALKYLSDIGTFAGSGPSFNRDPFLLGSFEQISHYRGGKAGRSKAFCLGFRGNTHIISENRNARESRDATFAIRYTKHLSQPTIQSIQFGIREEKMEFSFSSDWKNMRIVGSFESRVGYVA